MNYGSALSAVDLLGATQPVLYVQTQEHYHYFISASQSCFGAASAEIITAVRDWIVLSRLNNKPHEQIL